MNSIIFKATTIIAILAATLTAALGVVHTLYPALPVKLDINVYFSVLLLVLAAALTYIFDRTEKLESRTKAINDKLGVQTIEVYATRDQLFKRMREITVGSQMVHTQMYSSTPTPNTEFFTYMKETHRYVKRNPKVIFKRIITLGDEQKLKWIFGFMADMLGATNFSVAYIDLDQKPAILSCFHLVEKDKELFTFVFHTVLQTGIANAFLIRNPEVYQHVLNYYEALWHNCPKLMEGGKVNKAALENIAKKHLLDACVEYKALERKIMLKGQSN